MPNILTVVLILIFISFFVIAWRTDVKHDREEAEHQEWELDFQTRELERQQTEKEYREWEKKTGVTRAPRKG